MASKTTILTGASSGIGEATARRLAAKSDLNLVLFARREDRLIKLAREIDPSGARTLIVAGDLTVVQDRERLVQGALERFGSLYGLVNNAGYGQRGAIEQVPLDAIRRNFETNVFGLLGLTQLVLAHLRPQQAGRIVNVGSVAGKIARPLTSVYDSTKHALEAFNDALRGELKPFGIHVSLIRPGFVLTEFVDSADKVSASALAVPGPYDRFAQSMRGSARNLKKIAAQPDDIARCIEHALFSPHPKAHYAVPAHAKFFLFLRWLLPTAAIDHAIRLKP